MATEAPPKRGTFKKKPGMVYVPIGRGSEEDTNSQVALYERLGYEEVSETRGSIIMAAPVETRDALVKKQHDDGYNRVFKTKNEDVQEESAHDKALKETTISRVERAAITPQDMLAELRSEVESGPPLGYVE